MRTTWPWCGGEATVVFSRVQCCSCRVGRRHIISAYFYASLMPTHGVVAVPLLEKANNHLNGVTHPHRGVRVFNTAFHSCPPPSEVSPHAPRVLHNCSGGAVGEGRGCGGGPEEHGWQTPFFFFFFFYGGNSLLMNAGRVCSAAHQNPEATRHFASYVTPARQSGNNGGNNLDLCLKSIRRRFRRIPLSLIVSIPSPHTLHLQWENVSFLNTQTSRIW